MKAARWPYKGIGWMHSNLKHLHDAHIWDWIATPPISTKLAAQYCTQAFGHDAKLYSLAAHHNPASVSCWYVNGSSSVRTL
jgi:hypothetical protein